MVFMAYVLLSENCGGSHIKFCKQNGEFYHQEVGKVYTGTLALQTFEGSPYLRIRFKESTMGLIKKSIGINASIATCNPFKFINAVKEDFCHFDFSKEDLSQGRKKIRFVLERNGSSYMPVFFCYNFSTDKGCSYLFPSSKVAEEWAKRIGITTLEYMDENGNITNKRTL